MQKSVFVAWGSAEEVASLETADSALKFPHALLPLRGCGESTGFASAAGPPLLACWLAGLLACWLGWSADDWLADSWQLKFYMPKTVILDAWKVLLGTCWHPGALFC